MINLQTQSREIPDQINQQYPPDRETLLANGWRDEVEQPPIADGYTRLSAVAVEGDDGEHCAWQVVDKLTSQIIDEQKQARRDAFTASGLIPKAMAFRQLMRTYFGPDAETNQSVTREVVANYFLTTPDLTIQGVQHGMTLQALFEELSAWNGTGETWTLPWEVVP